MSEPHIRWLIRRDMQEVTAIERASFDSWWCEEEFIRCLRQRNTIGMVAEIPAMGSVGYKVGGYMVYELHKRRLHLINFAVHPDHRRSGIGRAMVDKLKSKLSDDHRTELWLEVRDSNLDAQLFFRAMGFRAIRVLKDYYEDTTDDAYQMQYLHREPSVLQSL